MASLMTGWYLVRECSSREFLSDWLSLTSIWLMSQALSYWLRLVAGQVLKHLLAESVIDGTTLTCMHLHTHTIIRESAKELQETE